MKLWDRFLAKIAGPGLPEEEEPIDPKPTPGLGPTHLPPEEPKP